MARDDIGTDFLFLPSRWETRRERGSGASSFKIFLSRLSHRETQGRNDS